MTHIQRINPPLSPIEQLHRQARLFAQTMRQVVQSGETIPRPVVGLLRDEIARLKSDIKSYLDVTIDVTPQTDWLLRNALSCLEIALEQLGRCAAPED